MAFYSGKFAAAPPTSTRSVPAKPSFPVQNTAGSRMKTTATAVVKAVSRAPVNAPVLNDSVSNSPGDSHTFTAAEVNFLRGFLETIPENILKNSTPRNFGQYIMKKTDHLVSFKGMTQTQIGYRVRAAFPDLIMLIAKATTGKKLLFTSNVKQKSVLNVQVPTARDNKRELAGQFQLAGSDDNTQPQSGGTGISITNRIFSKAELQILRDVLYSCKYNLKVCNNRIFGRTISNLTKGLIDFEGEAKSDVGKYVRAAFPEFEKYVDVGGGGQFSGHGTAVTGAGTNQHSNIPSALDDDSTSIHTYSTEELHILNNILKSCSVFIKRGYSDRDLGRYVEKQTAGAVSFEGLRKSEIGRSVRAAFPDCKQQNQSNKVFVVAAKLKLLNMDIPTQKDDEQQCGIDGTEGNSEDPELDPEYVVEMSLADLHLKPKQMNVLRAKAISLLAHYNSLGLTNKMFGKYMREGLNGKISFDPFSNYQIGYLISVTFPDIVEGPPDGAKRLAAKFSKHIPQKQFSVSSAKASHDVRKHKPRQVVPYQQTSNQFAEYDQMGASSRYPAYMYDDPVEYMPKHDLYDDPVQYRQRPDLYDDPVEYRPRPDLYDDPVEYRPRPDLYDDPVEYRPRPDLYDVYSPALMPARASEKRRYPWPDDDDVYTTYSHPPPVRRRSYTRVTTTQVVEYGHGHETSASPAPALMSQETDRALTYPPPSYQGDVETRPSFIHSPPSYPTPPKRDVETDSAITHHPSSSREAIEDRELKDIQTLMQKLDEERDKLAAKLEGLKYMVQDKRANYL